MADPTPIEVSTIDPGGGLVVRPEGEIDMSRSPDLRTALRGALDRRPERLVVDLSGVEYMDSSGLATLVDAMRAAKSKHAEMILAGMTVKVRAVFEMARLHQFFTIVDSVEEAVGK